MKKQMERLLNGELITVSFDEQVVFSQLEQDESAIWSLLVASGYLKVEDAGAMVSSGYNKSGNGKHVF